MEKLLSRTLYFRPMIWFLAGLFCCLAVAAQAQFTSRYTGSFRGNFVLIGNTLAQDAGPGLAAPVVGTVGAAGTNTADTAPDVFWRSDSPADGQAEANTAITAAQARSTAVLNLPTGAVVKKAMLYMAGRAPGGVVPTSATLSRPGDGGFSSSITPDGSSTVSLNGTAYQVYEDVTSTVQANGNGAYRVSDLGSVSMLNLNDATIFFAWSMVVIYELSTETYRDFEIQDGFNFQSGDGPLTCTFSGLDVKVGTALLGVVAYEGDDQSTGDGLTVNGTAFSDALNPADNVFNSTRSASGSAVSVMGDLPQLTGSARSMSGIDMDKFDITSLLMLDATSYAVAASTTSDTYLTGYFVSAVPTTDPCIVSAPTAYEVSGGGLDCTGAGVSVLLDNSASGVSYQLQRNGGDVGSPVPGIDNTLDFGNQTVPGTYTVVATDDGSGCMAAMTGSAVVTVGTEPTFTLASTAGATLSTCGQSTSLVPLNLVTRSVSYDAVTETAGSAIFGATNFNVSGEVVLVDDGTAPTNNGCEAIINNVAGKIALIQRGSCNYTLKTKNAQNAGATGVIIYNNVTNEGPMNMGGVDLSVTIPAVSLSKEAGETLLAAIQVGPVTATLTSYSYSYDWSTGSTDPNILVTPTETTTYGLTVTNTAGCTSTQEITVTQQPTPTGMTATNVSGCNNGNTTCTTDDYYTADIVVTYNAKPGSGTLALSGADIVGTPPEADVALIGATSHTFNAVKLRNDGQATNVTAGFSMGCTLDKMVGTAASPCSSGGSCAVSNITATTFSACNDNGTGTSADDYFTTDVTVTFAFAPGAGNLTLKRGTSVLATKAAADLSCATTWTFINVQVPSDGASVALTAEFDGSCTYTSGPLGTAPGPCSMAGVLSGGATICPGGTAALVVTVTGGVAPYDVTLSNGTDTQITSGYASGSNIGVSPSASGTWTIVSLEDSNGENGDVSGSAVVTLEDNDPPTAICKPVFVTLNAAGTATISAADANNGSSDNCPESGSLSYAVSPNVFDCDDAGNASATLTVTDAVGNTASCTATVTVLDVLHYSETPGLRTASDGLAGDNLGWGLGLSGGIVVAGAPNDKVGTQNKQGSAYVFLQDQGGAGNWGQSKQLRAFNGAAVDYYGNAVSVEGNTAAVAAYGFNHPLGGTDVGTVYIYEKDLGGTNNWGFRTGVGAFDGAAYDYFGSALSLKDNVVAVGANKKKVGANSAQGAVYLYQKDVGGLNNWSHVDKVVASDGGANNFFGQSLSQSNDYLLVGAPGNLNNRGAAYVFWHPANYYVWSQQQKLTASDAAVGDGFGTSVSVSNGCALIGAPNKATYTGAAYVFKHNAGSWSQAKKLTASDGAVNDRFGSSVALQGDYAYVTAIRAGGNAGAVYVFHKDAGGTDNWGQIGKYSSGAGASGDQFGYALGVSGDMLAVGANLDDVASKADQGSIYIFTGEDCPDVPKPGNSTTAQAEVGAGLGSVQCSPNPFRDELTVEIGTSGISNLASEIRVMDATGRVAMRVELPAGQTRHTLNTATLKVGLYFVQVSSEAGVQVVPVVLLR